MNIHLIPSYEALMALLPGLHPEEHHVLLNTAHPLVDGHPDGFIRLVREAKGLVTDFDGTLHVGVQWLGPRALLPEPARLEDEAAAAAYFTRSSHDDTEDVMLALGSAWRMRDAGLTEAQMQETGRKLETRSGAWELLTSFDLRKVAIVSFGLEPIVSAWAYENIRRAEWMFIQTFALRFSWRQAPMGSMSRLLGDPDVATVVTDGNKGYLRRAYCVSRGLAPRETLVLGDAPTDILMMGHDVPGIIVIPRVDPQPARIEHRLKRMAELWDQVACIVVSDTLDPIVEMRR